MMAWQRSALSVLAGASLLAVGGRAGATPGFVVEETVTGGQGPQKRVTYVSESALRVEENGKVQLFAVGAGGVKLYELSPKERVAKDDSAMAPMMLLGNMFFLEQDGQGVRAKRDFFTPTAERKAVGKWSARKLTATVMGFPAVYWYTRDSKELVEAERMRMRFFARANESFMGAQPGASPEQKKMVAAMTRAVDDFADRTAREYGAAVLTEASMGGMSSTTQVVSVARADHAQDVFALPKGYKVVQGGPMGR